MNPLKKLLADICDVAKFVPWGTAAVQVAITLLILAVVHFVVPDTASPGLRRRSAPAPAVAPVPAPTPAPVVKPEPCRCPAPAPQPTKPAPAPAPHRCPPTPKPEPFYVRCPNCGVTLRATPPETGAKPPTGDAAKPGAAPKAAAGRAK
jgi:outer membrane biosynthesis protein TonB